jgi:flagellar protein FliS
MTLVIASKAYQDELFEADPGRMVVMLYDETLEALRTAIDAIERGDIEERFNATTVATEVLVALFQCLDMEKGGAIAGNLASLYTFILKDLLWVNVNNDPEPARQAIRLLTPLRDAWSELDATAVVDILPQAPAAITLRGNASYTIESEREVA